MTARPTPRRARTSPVRVRSVTVPAILGDGVGRTRDGAAWIADLPRLVGAAAARWALDVGEPFTTGYAAWCAPALASDGAEVVVKISFPQDEARHEPTALRAWDGCGAARLVDACADDWALVLERVRPGTTLAAHDAPPVERLLAGAEVLRSLTQPGLAEADAPGIPRMADVCRRWADLVAERAGRAAHERDLELDPGLVRAAVDVLRTLPGSCGTGVVVHGDLNPGNVLRSAGAGWLAIDPKPLLGDPAFDPWPLLEQVDDPFRSADPCAVLTGRTRVVAHELDLDPGRIAAWGLARSVESALWAWAELGDVAGARASLARAATWSSVTG